MENIIFEHLSEKVFIESRIKEAELRFNTKFDEKEKFEFRLLFRKMHKELVKSERLMLAKEILLTRPEILNITPEDEDFFESKECGMYEKLERIDGHNDYCISNSNFKMKYNLKDNAKDKQLVRAAYSIADELIRQNNRNI
jgi:hypothetical protein